MRLSRVLDHIQIMAIGDIQNYRHVGRVAVDVYGQNGFGARGDGFFDFLGVNVPGQRFAVNEHRFGAHVGDAVGGSHVSKVWQDNLILGADAQG